MNHEGPVVTGRERSLSEKLGRMGMRWLLGAVMVSLTAGGLLLGCQKDTPTEADEEAPTVQVTYPPGNTSVSGVIIITAEASDNEAVERVEFYINEVLKATVEEEPWEYSWETLILDNGTKHTIMAEAYDPSGNMGTSEEVSVVVNNEINDPPTATILIPEDSTSFALDESIHFSGEGRDALGNALRDDQLSWFSDRDGYLGTGASLSRDDLSAEWHTIKLVATDDRDLYGRDSVAVYISAEMEIIQVTFDEADEEYPCWSPDSRNLAYASNRAGNTDIWMVSVAGGQPTQLTDDLGDDWDPDWHDSEIAFTSNRGSSVDIWKITDSGKNLVQLTDNQGLDCCPSWSSDGQSIAFSSQLAGGLLSLWILYLDGSDPVQLTTQFAYDPDWFFGDIIFGSGANKLYITSIAGTTPQQITWGASREWSPSWSPEGDAIVFTSDRSGNEDIWVWSFADSRYTQLTFNSGRDYQPTWSPDGQWIAFVSDRNGTADLWIVQTP